ncbi:unnamed protein product [Aspergillus oryzae var. brunneus]|uniref:Unnamed protein product n=2 Tax=Aspergillus oryzae TaxID=5062 RepID=A0AAN4YEU5_ASPOZ|nr:unnamed protein product [Aspergillus oryzae]GMG44968.1 unnamed protein product [Aspergillus oryzae var. brunneus]
MTELADLDPLRNLTKLTHLVLLENPITRKEHYRYWVIWRIPSVRFLDYQKVKDAEREKAQELFGTAEEPSALASKIMGIKSRTFDVPSGSLADRAPADKAVRVQLTEAERKRVEKMIREARSLQEIARLEKELNEGRIPGGALDAAEDPDQMQTRRIFSLASHFQKTQSNTPQKLVQFGTASSSTMAPQAPWRSLFQSHLTQNSSTSFTLSTVDHDSQNRPVPRSRTCEFRGFWPSPQLHDKAVEALNSQGIGQNPAVYESDMISLTTDVRMEKVGQLDSSANVVEGIFWLTDVGNQWRVKGEAFVIGDPKGGAHEEAARKEIQTGMNVTGKDADVSEWTWERQPRTQEPADPNLKLGQKVDDLQDSIARGNFRVVVIRPNEVERLDLSDLQNVRRVRWTFVPADNTGGQGEWVETELWP